MLRLKKHFDDTRQVSTGFNDTVCFHKQRSHEDQKQTSRWTFNEFNPPPQQQPRCHAPPPPPQPPQYDKKQAAETTHDQVRSKINEPSKYAVSLCETMNQEWQRGYRAWFAYVWQDPRELVFELPRMERKRLLIEAMSTSTNCFNEGLQEAKKEWTRVQNEKAHARDVRLTIPPSRCAFCHKVHDRSPNQGENDVVNKECMDIQFRLATLAKDVQDKGTSISGVRDWFQPKQTWVKQPLQVLPQDVAKFGKLVTRDGCGLLFAHFGNYACMFNDEEVKVPALSRSNTNRVLNKDIICVVDDRWNAVVLCARCGERFDFEFKPTLFDTQSMHYVDMDNSDNQDFIDDCYPVKNAILFQNQVIHPSCKPILENSPNTGSQPQQPPPAPTQQRPPAQTQQPPPVPPPVPTQQQPHLQTQQPPPLPPQPRKPQTMNQPKTQIIKKRPLDHVSRTQTQTKTNTLKKSSFY